MKSAEHWLVHKHTQFEELFRLLHDAADISDWWAVDQYFTDMTAQLRYHMAQEEEVLFPAYDVKCKVLDRSSKVSTRDLCNEHSKFRDMFRELEICIRNKDSECVIMLVAALELLMAEHNEKEEYIFLPFASRLLFEERDRLQEKLSKFVFTGTSRNMCQ